MSQTMIESITLTTMTCGHCGCHFAIPEYMRAEKHKTGGEFYCPNGHPRTYVETEVDRLRKEVDKKRQEVERQREAYFAEQRAHESTQRKLAKTVKEKTNLEKRTAAGVCPCCKRTFSQLARHMHTKHEDFVKEHGIPTVAEPKP